MVFGNKNNEERIVKAEIDSAFKEKQEEKERERLEAIKNELDKERKKLEYERWFCSLSIEDQKKEEERVREEKRLEAERRQAYEEEKLKETEKQKICPYCKSELVLRNGKNGKFYGCSNFPKCRYTANFEE